MSQNECCTNPDLQPNQQKELKKFNECMLEEKVERLHMVVKQLRQSLEYSYNQNCTLSTRIYALEMHRHSKDGDCMIKIQDANRLNNDRLIGVPSTLDLLG